MSPSGEADTIRKVEVEILRRLEQHALPLDELAAGLAAPEEVRAELEALQTAGLVERSTLRLGSWHLTDAGRARLEQLGPEGDG